MTRGLKSYVTRATGGNGAGDPTGEAGAGSGGDPVAPPAPTSTDLTAPSKEDPNDRQEIEADLTKLRQVRRTTPARGKDRGRKAAADLVKAQPER